MTRGDAVLVVDDEADVREVAVALFESLGLTVFEAADGREALELLAAHPEIAVLFSDVRMPGMDGTQLTAAALRRWPRLRVVLTSGYLGPAKLPDVAFVPKPYRLGDLASAVGANRGH